MHGTYRYTCIYSSYSTIFFFCLVLTCTLFNISLHGDLGSPSCFSGLLWLFFSLWLGLSSLTSLFRLGSRLFSLLLLFCRGKKE